MSIIDITVPISPATPTYPGDPEIHIQQWSSLRNGDQANVTMLHFGAHTATHVDAPAHFIEGAGKVDSLLLESLIGRAIVCELSDDAYSITPQDLPHEGLKTVKRILFKTRNSSFWKSSGAEFRTDFAFLEPEAAQALMDAGVCLVGIDYLSIEKFHSGNHETHIILLSNNAVILEGLDLSEVRPGEYELICLPLKIGEGTGDGAPARAVLRTLD
jgi:arylformamidase